MSKQESLFVGKPVVIRSNMSGVWLGKLVEFVDENTVIIEEARRAWFWEGAGSCTGLAKRGPSGGRICEPVELARISDVCETLLATNEAVERWIAITPWTGDND